MNWLKTLKMGCCCEKDYSFLEPFSFEGLKARAKLVRVIDGDTVDLIVKVENLPRKFVGSSFVARLRCRLYGVDCPEIKTVEGQRAKAWMDRHLNSYFPVSFMKNDKYGRVLVEIGNLAQELIKAGLGVPYFGGKKV